MIDPNTEDQVPVSLQNQSAGNRREAILNSFSNATQITNPQPSPIEEPSNMAEIIRRSFDDELSRKQHLLNASIYQATSKNPDEEAAAQKLGADTGVQADFALRNKDELARRKAMDDARGLDLTNNNPALANKLIADPQFAAVAHDDLSWWDKYGKLAHSVLLPVSNPARFAESVMPTSMGKAFAGGMQVPVITELQREQASSPNGVLPPDKEQELQALEAQQAQTQQETGGMLNTPASMAGNIVGMGESLANFTSAGGIIGGTAGLLGGPFAEVTVPGGMIAGATKGFSVGMAALFAKQAMYANYRQSRLQGISHEQAISNARIVGIANAVFNAGAIKLVGAPIGAAISSLTAPVTESVVVPTAKAILFDYVKAYGLHEVGAFGLGAGLKASEIGAAKISGIKTTEGAMNIAEEILTSGVHTAYDFALLNALFPLLPAAAQYRVLKDSEMRQAKFKAKIKSVAENNKTKKRSPQQMQNGIESVTPESEQFIYVDQGSINRVLMQSGASAKEIEQILPGVLAQINANEPDIKINSAHYLANSVAGTDIGKALEPNLRMEKGGLSPNEILQQNIDASRVRAEAKAAVEQYAKMNAGFVESAQKVEDLYFNQFVAAGLDTKFARFKAMLIRDWYATNAARANMMPDQLQAQKAYEAISEQQARERQAAQQAPVATQRPDDVVITGKSFQQEKDSGDFEGLNHEQAVELSAKKSQTETDKLRKLADDAPVGTTLNDFSGRGYYKKVSGGAWVLFTGGANKLRIGGKFFESKKNPFAILGIKKNFEYRFEYPAPEQQAPAQGSLEQAQVGQQDPNILRQEAVPATFYSALGVEVGKSTTKSASADSWKQQIKGLIAKGVVKEKEVYWSGIDNWLALQEGKITKEQVQAFLDAGGVKVEVETKGNKLTLSLVATNIQDTLEAGQVFDIDAQDALEQWQKPEVSEKLKLQYEALLNEKLNDAGETRLVSDYVSDVSETKYDAYQLPGGTNYREALVTLPEKARDTSGYTAKLLSGPDDMGLGEWQVMNGDRFVGNSISSYTKENAIQTAANRENREKPTGYMSSHWDQPNVLVHLRMND
ncbi:MAG: hypothetical protein WCP53_02935, partial [Verrucomicrobiota bacterium]